MTLHDISSYIIVIFVPNVINLMYNNCAHAKVHFFIYKIIYSYRRLLDKYTSAKVLSITDICQTQEDILLKNRSRFCDVFNAFFFLFFLRERVFLAIYMNDLVPV